MSSNDEQILRDQSLVYSLRDGMAWSVMVGFGEQYVGAFAIFLAATSMQMGVLAALPPFLGAMSQVFGAHLTEKLQNRRKIIVPAAALQGILWLPLIAIPFMAPPNQAVAALIFFVTLFSVAGHFISPAWNSLMGDLVPEDTRGAYFARRNRICHCLTIVSVGLAGLLLHIYKSSHGEDPRWHTYGFVTLFLIAGVARLVSAVYLSKQYDPPYAAPPEGERFGYFDFLRSVPRSNFARYVLFVAVMNFSIFLSAPFFVVYLLRDLGFTYLQFTTINVLAVVAHILTLTFWGRASDRFGNKWVLTASGMGIAFAPFLLPISTNFYFISLFTLLIASAGAGFTLAAANYIFDAVSPPQRARCVAYYSMTNAAGVLIGGLAGGWLAERLPADVAVGAFQLHLASNLLMLFVLSGLFRVMTMLSFKTTFRELRAVDPAPKPRTLFRLAFLESTDSSAFEPFGEKKNPRDS